MTEALNEKLKKLSLLKEKYRQLDEQTKRARKEHDRYQDEVYGDLREAGLLTIKTDSGTFACKSTIYAKVQDPDAFVKWAEEQGLKDEFLKQKEVGARLNEYVRDAVANGSPLPDGTIWYPREYISITND